MDKPAHLTAENASRFQDQSVVELYDLRRPYPVEIFDALIGLIRDVPRTVLDVGTGTGVLARSLVDRVDRVDAVDWSGPMIARGKTLPGGDHPRLHWIEGRIEEVELQPPYALVIAGDSLHWMDWETVLPRFRTVSTPHAVVAVLSRDDVPPPWQGDLTDLIVRYTYMYNFQPYDLFDELEKRQLFRLLGKFETTPLETTQSVDDYIASFHSRAGLSRDRMPAGDALAFDRALLDLLEPWNDNGAISLQTVSGIVWGLPLAPQSV
jgi:ubiquinone/menaquinone biosynthesis C-methylase UbiE